MKKDWTIADIPDLSGKVAVVTGANIGLGMEIAKRVAEKGATTILACRNATKAGKARDELQAALGSAANLEVMALDVSSLASVAEFCTAFTAKYSRLDILMCNAGVMALEERQESVDGIELQLATNHIGHFALVGRLLPVLAATAGSRVVTQSSSGNWQGAYDWDDLNGEKQYGRWKQYSFTKLANVAFATELNKRIAAAGLPGPTAFSVHPGLVIGQLQSVSAGNSAFYKFLYGFFARFAGTYQTGALPALYACTEPEAEKGEFYGPNGMMRGTFRGDHPTVVEPNALAKDDEQIEKLWAVSEQMSKFTYDFAVNN